MYCMYCGTKLADVARFCPNCGKQIERETAAGTDEPVKIRPESVIPQESTAEEEKTGVNAESVEAQNAEAQNVEAQNAGYADQSETQKTAEEAAASKTTAGPTYRYRAGSASHAWNEAQTHTKKLDDSAAGMIIARAVSYIPYLFWIPLLVDSDSRKNRISANQGLWLTIITFLCTIVIPGIAVARTIHGLLHGAFTGQFTVTWIAGILGLLGYRILYVFDIAVLVLTIIGIVMAVEDGDPFVIPLIGKLQLIREEKKH